MHPKIRQAHVVHTRNEHRLDQEFRLAGGEPLQANLRELCRVVTA